MQTCVGILQQAGKNGRVIFDRYDSLLGKEVRVDANHLAGAPFGMKVVCELLTDITEPVTEPARAKIIEVLGDPGNRDVAMLSIIRQHHLPEKFPEPVLAAASEKPLTLDEATINQAIEKGRRDLRGEQIMTIDGEDAKDLDDAISIYKYDDGSYRLDVHIADVTHYVQENDLLDQEAQKRATSVYLVDRVIPMLPPRLSNGICSLNPDQDRLAMTASLVIDQNGEIIKGELFESVIRSQVRSSYNEVKEAIEQDTLPENRPDWYLDTVKQMQALASLLSKKRLRRGTIEFEFPETHVDLDEKGKPVDIYAYPITFANGIIEEFMIAANEYIAELAEKENMPFVYRVHELPDPEKLKRFMNLARLFGVRVRLRGAPTPGQLAQVLETVKHETYGQTLSQLLLRSLAKARYAPDNLGHFGLASSHYCHFTSPIRRYPDLFIHRVLKAYLHRGMKRKKWQPVAEHVSEHASDMERTAMFAERDTVDQKAAEYFSERIGEHYTGIISGFNQAGLYVQLENTIEGMVPFRTMDGYISFDEEHLRAVNETTGQLYSIGDAVTVQVAQADPVLRRIDFELIEHQDTKLKSTSKGSGSKNRKKQSGYKKKNADKQRSSKPGQKSSKNKKTKKNNKKRTKKK